MAFRRELSTRSTLIARRYQPCFSYLPHDNNRRDSTPSEAQPKQNIPNFARWRPFSNSFSSRDLSRYSHLSVLPTTGSSLCRYMSTAIGEGAEKVGIVSDVAEVLKDTTLESVASQLPAVNEVTVAAADNYFPVQLLQYFIDNVHTATGFNWWASIVVTTLIIRTSTIPLLINQLKSTSKLAILRPRLEEVKDQMQATGMDPAAVSEGQKKMQALFKEHGVTPFSPLKGVFIQGPIFVSFFLAISNMAEKVPSFKDGGIFWFTDLSTPDSLYIFPVLTALSFWITIECNLQEGVEGNPHAKTMKTVSRVFAALSVPLTMSFPKAIFCYWITSNAFSLMYGVVIKRPGVKEYLGIPKIPDAPPSTSKQAPFSLSSALKQLKAMTNPPLESSAVGQTTTVDQRIGSSSVTSQRLRTLENKVKGRKKYKKK